MNQTTEPEAGGITVVIPTLGRPSLERALASVALQTAQPVEVIIVENGPTPIDEVRRSRLSELAPHFPIIFVSLPPFTGPSMSRNLGAWRARTELIAFLDDDDEFDVKYLETMLLHAEAEECHMLYGTKVWQEDGTDMRKEKRIGAVPPEDWLPLLYRQRNPGFGGTNIVVRRDTFFRLGGFPTYLPSGEDRALAMAALRAKCQIGSVDDAVVYCYTPVGYRAKRRSDKWITNLRLIYEYWPDVTWHIRVRSALRWIRSIPRPIALRRTGEALRRISAVRPFQRSLYRD